MLLLKRKFRLARTVITAALVLPMLVVVGSNRNDVAKAQGLTLTLAAIRVDGNDLVVRTSGRTVGEILFDAQVDVGEMDKVVPEQSTVYKEGMTIKVVRIREAQVEKTVPIGFNTVKTFTKALGPGVVKTTRPGQHGAKVVKYHVRYEDNKVVDKTLLDAQVVSTPKNRVVSIGSRGNYMSRGEFTTRKVMRMEASAYDPGPGSCGPRATGRTSCGLRAGYGVVAVDPRVIRLGTRLYIEGYGMAVAGDIGRAIKGNRIDLGYKTRSEALRFGRRSVIVHILER